MTALQAQLARLARQAGRAGVAGWAPPPPTALPAPRAPDTADLAERARLRALLEHRQRAACRDLPGAAVAQGVQHIEHQDGSPLAIEAIRPDWIGGDPIATRRLVLLDTETTGLAGGTGTKAFIVGLATLERARIHVRQWLLTRMMGETALLQAVAAALPADPVLVTYNGKSFDLPLLRTRYRMNRLREPFGDALHLDLLHPIRRRFRGIWPNCRLATVEDRLLGRPRVDDLPGSEAPAAWRRFLLSGDTGGVRRVLTHNARDLVSLAHVLQQLLALDGAAQR